MSKVLAHEGIPARVIPCSGRWDRRSIGEIRETIRDYRPDVLHTHGYKADIYGYVAGRKMGAPMVATCHNWTESSAALKLYAWADRRMLCRFAKVVAVSAELAGRLRESHISRVASIRNGIVVDSFAGAEATLRKSLPDPGRMVIGMAARLVRAKGISTVLEVVREVLAAFPKTLFVFVGDGPDRAAFESQSTKLGIGASVVFTGTRADMPGVYKSFDIFLLPSVNEGLPMSLLEAMAAGVPVIATAVGGIPEVVRGGQTGLLVKPADAGELSAAIVRLLSDSGLRTRLGLEGQQLVRRLYSAERMTQDYFAVYREVKEGAVAD
jgi:glycosyltransferase involved in cell wall biosynthesis